MAHQQFDALKIVRDALDTEPADRDEYVSMRCGADTALRERVDGLLKRIAAADSTDEGAGPELATFAHGAGSTDALVGQMLGPFRVAERIGRGGMGIVYRGERQGADFAQEVAIKLIRRGYDFDDVHARFLRERRILARLSHPNLARFIDGGIANDGRPWFALEFVDGQSITEWCDAHRLDIRARVRLFLEVCTAVQYAHTQLIVHRDLKPGNVLVDETGAVRLLDFGVAGLLAGDGDDASQPSTIGLHAALTPEYAAPEQLAGEPVGVSADVYALGVILYELIGGVLPHMSDRRAADAVARAINEIPQPLVTAINRTKSRADKQRNVTVDTVARERTACRRTDPRAFRRLVRGDLSRIVQKALAGEPYRRYATVANLSDDLTSWLRGAPVHATGNGRGYRIIKFVARHRVAVVASIAAAALMIGFGIYHVITLNDELARTQIQRNRAEASLGFMHELIASPDPQMGAGPDTKLGDFLQGSAATISKSPTLDAQTRAELQLTLASSLKSIDRYDEALSIATTIAESGSDAPQAWTTRVLAETLVGEILTLKGEYPEALARLASAQELAEAHSVSDPLTMATLLSNQSIANNHLGQWDESIRQIDRAVEIARSLEEENPEFLANLIGFQSIPRAYPKTDLPAAEAFLRESLALQVRQGLASSGLYPNTLGELAQAIIDQGRFEEAEPLLLEAAAKMKERFGPNHRETSFKLGGVALLYFRWNRLDEARLWRDEATHAMQVALGDSHPFVALSLIQSSDVAFYSGDLRRAAADSASAAEIASDGDREQFSARAQLYAAAARCAQGDRSAPDVLLKRVADLKDTFTVRGFDVRLAAANCLDHFDRHDEALAAIEPYARKLADNAPRSRSDYVAPWIARVKARTIH